MRNVNKTQAGIKTAGRNINSLRYAGDTTLVTKNENEPLSFPRGSRTASR